MAKKQANYLQASGPEWDRQRMRAMVRDDFYCLAHELGLCKEPCTENRPRFLQVHHKEMRINGGSHDLDNLITVCRAHHAQIHPWMEKDLPYSDKESSYPLREL